ncbi:hypothetical protein EXIGLDRAFT_775958 [Exidia glandulosa HHB12029]|uniref:Uncharacterized protein n=1 Tax=Exidia glandulosa HHB12029 TaxID=1314781 RepID=A0A165DP47_EXIGL|nr:hypothetical protein EXIGLDRAFT_775958 [Exidia glandulosa HHB12029]
MLQPAQANPISPLRVSSTVRLTSLRFLLVAVRGGQEDVSEIMDHLCFGPLRVMKTRYEKQNSWWDARNILNCVKTLQNPVLVEGDLQNVVRRRLLLNHMRRSLVKSQIKIVALLWPSPPQKGTKDSTGRPVSFQKPAPDEFDAVVHVNPTQSPEQLAVQIKSVMEKGQNKREEEVREFEPE